MFKYTDKRTKLDRLVYYQNHVGMKINITKNKLMQIDTGASKTPQHQHCIKKALHESTWKLEIG